MVTRIRTGACGPSTRSPGGGDGLVPAPPGRNHSETPRGPRFAGSSIKNAAPGWGPRFLELLPGFEPGTSSLPTEPGLFFLTLACCFLKPQGIETTGFFHFQDNYLLCLAISSRVGFYAVGVGFGVGFYRGPPAPPPAPIPRRTARPMAFVQSEQLPNETERTAEKAAVTVGRDRGRGWPSG